MRRLQLDEENGFPHFEGFSKSCYKNRLDEGNFLTKRLEETAKFSIATIVLRESAKFSSSLFMSVENLVLQPPCHPNSLRHWPCEYYCNVIPLQNDISDCPTQFYVLDLLSILNMIVRYVVGHFCIKWLWPSNVYRVIIPLIQTNSRYVTLSACILWETSFLTVQYFCNNSWLHVQIQCPTSGITQAIYQPLSLLCIRCHTATEA